MDENVIKSPVDIANRDTNLGGGGLGFLIVLGHTLSHELSLMESLAFVPNSHFSLTFILLISLLLLFFFRSGMLPNLIP